MNRRKILIAIVPSSYLCDSYKTLITPLLYLLKLAVFGYSCSRIVTFQPLKRLKNINADHVLWKILIFHFLPERILLQWIRTSVILHWYITLQIEFPPQKISSWKYNFTGILWVFKVDRRLSRPCSERCCLKRIRFFNGCHVSFMSLHILNHSHSQLWHCLV